MKDVVDDIVDTLAQARHLKNFVPLNKTFDDTADMVGVRLAKVLRRTTLSPDAVLTVDEVIEAVGGRAPVVRTWLRDSVVPLRHPSGRIVFRWGDVLNAMRGAA
ncbi:MAG TPA: hypothetical protein PLF11_04955 [Bacillota bacterium]|nr:hypothetical protein [Bacillota bacterium]